MANSGIGESPQEEATTILTQGVMCFVTYLCVFTPKMDYVA